MKLLFCFLFYGESGKMFSDVVVLFGDCVDDMVFIYNVIGKMGVYL